MPLLIDGKLRNHWHDTQRHDGAFIRQSSLFRNGITADGKAGFKAEKNRYHLVASYGDSWAHRTLISRVQKGLESVVPLTAVDPILGHKGWSIDTIVNYSGKKFNFVYELYLSSDKHYTGRVTLPLLWDNVTSQIVNNESADIMRIFNTGFGCLANNDIDLYPKELQEKIDIANEFIYQYINNGVYQVGFATAQWAYQEALSAVFDGLDKLENILHTQRYIAGNVITEADWRLFASLLRFDIVYFPMLKCNLKRLQDYPYLWNYTRELYQVPGINNTVNMEHIRQTYYSFVALNPTCTIPAGPNPDFEKPTTTVKYQIFSTSDN